MFFLHVWHIKRAILIKMQSDTKEASFLQAADGSFHALSMATFDPAVQQLGVGQWWRGDGRNWVSFLSLVREKKPAVFLSHPGAYSIDFYLGQFKHLFGKAEAVTAHSTTSATLSSERCLRDARGRDAGEETPVRLGTLSRKVQSAKCHQGNFIPDEIKSKASGNNWTILLLVSSLLEWMGLRRKTGPLIRIILVFQFACWNKLDSKPITLLKRFLQYTYTYISIYIYMYVIYIYTVYITLCILTRCKMQK